MISLFTWSGQYFGFIVNGNVFTANSRYCAWIDSDNQVWRADGNYLGELVEQNYVLRQTLKVTPVPRVPHVPPVPPVPPIPPMPRMPRVPLVGYVDALL